MKKLVIATIGIVLALASIASAQQPGWETQPAQPAWGAQPTQPGWGTQPTQPTQPGWGTQPTQPSQPGWGTQPSGPEAPEAPNDMLKFGLGFSNHFAPLFNTSNTLTTVIDTVDSPPADMGVGAASAAYANLSFRWRFAETHEMDVILGMGYLRLSYQDWTPPGSSISAEEIAMSGFLFDLGGRYIFTIAGAERVRLYTGGGLGLIIGSAWGDEDDATHLHESTSALVWGISVGAPLGFEYRFEAAPSLALTMEIGVGFTYLGGSTEVTPPSGSPDPTREDSGGLFLFGIGQAPDLSDDIYIPVIDHLSFGLHYWF